MRTTTRTVILALAVSAVIAAVALLFIFRFLLPPRETKTAPQAAYTIAAWEGKVAVFEGDDAYPMQILDTDVAGLPEKERNEVLRGIAVTNPEQLYLILEDYTN